MNPKGKAIIFSAPSGAGKTTIVHALLKKGLPLEFSVSACSREKRGNEKHGKDYYFIGINGFKEEIDKNGFVEWEEVYPDQFYGTLKSEIDRIWNQNKAVIFDVDVYGGIEIKRQLGDKALAIFVDPTSMKELEKRLKGRKTESAEKIEMRLKKASQELDQKTNFDRVIVNDNLEQAIQNAHAIVFEFLSQ